MAMTVAIDINGVYIRVLSVVRRKPLHNVKPNSRCTYDVLDDEGVKIGELRGHRYGDGAERLAIKMLRKFGGDEWRRG